MECVGPTPGLPKQNLHFNKMPGASCAGDPGDPGMMRQGHCAPGQAGSPAGSALLAPRLFQGMRECSEQVPQQVDGAHEGCPRYGGCGAGELVSLLWGSLHPGWPAVPLPPTPRAQGGAGRAALSMEGRSTRRKGQGSVVRAPSRGSLASSLSPFP